jgi:hypothetical protein
VLGGQPPDLGVQHAVQQLALLRVGEHERAERRPVEGAVRCQHPRAERVDDRVEPGRARTDGLAREHVVVDHRRAELLQPARGHRLARGDPARESDPLHPAMLPHPRRALHRRAAP